MNQQQIRQLFAEALARATLAERENFLHEACRGDLELLAHVASLLQAHDQAGDFLAQFPPALEQRPWREGQPGGVLRYLGDYELREEIGRGGMGVVFRARQVTLNRMVAVKMILAGEFAGLEQRRRFRREAEAAAQLRHPNIVSIHEVGDHQGRAYYSMDLVEGRSLAEVLHSGALPAHQAAALLKTLAEAVHYAHQRGTLHRDLKPHNVILGQDGQPHILDFGLARPLVPEPRMTRTGEVMGSPSYMPPEQALANAAEIGPPTDVYALGAILYQTITGQPPFTGETVVDILTQVINREPAPPRRLNPSVPADLETICLKCLEKRPERRYHSARALAEELERFLNFEPILARPAGRLRQSWNWAQRHPWVFAAAFGLAALALFCLAFGLWEHARYVAWRLQANKVSLPEAQDLFSRLLASPAPPSTASQSILPPSLPSLAPLFFLAFPALCLLLYLTERAFRIGCRNQLEGRAPVTLRTLLLHALAGAGAAAVGLGYLLLQIQWWTWRPSSPGWVALELPASLCALALDWMGFRMIWEAAGVLETSRYRETVNRSISQTRASERRRRLAFVWIGLLWWVYAPTLALLVLVAGSSLTARMRELAAAFAGMALCGAAGALAVWAVRRRRRILVFVCAPVSVALCFFVFVALTADNKTVGVLLLFYVLSAIQALIACPMLIPPRETTPGQSAPFPASPTKDVALGAALLAVALALFYSLENKRGAAAWANCRRVLRARGARLDWAAYLPPRLPDDQNFFKAPHMADWLRFDAKFYSPAPGQEPPNALRALLEDTSPLFGSNAVAKTVSLAEIQILPLTTNLPAPPPPPGADLVLRWQWRQLSQYSESQPIAQANPTNASHGPQTNIKIDAVPLSQAIQALANQLGWSVTFDPALSLEQSLTLQWRQVSPEDALLALLSNYGLCVLQEDRVAIKRITRAPDDSPAPRKNEAILPHDQKVDLIAFDQVPLRDAIATLALQASVNIIFDPTLPLNELITGQWRQLGASQGLSMLLYDHGLALVDPYPGSPIKQVVRRFWDNQGFSASEPARTALLHAITNALGPLMIGPQGELITRRATGDIQPARIAIFCDRSLATNELEQLFLDYLTQDLGSHWYAGRVLCEATPGAPMEITASRVVGADDYDSRSHALEPQIKMVREALRRPFAQMDLDYQDPFNLIRANLVTMRLFVQRLGASATAHLLRGQPDKALQELTLVHQLRRLLDGEPAGQPETIISAMMNTAVTGLYVLTLQNGLRLHAWTLDQLPILQGQLAEIDLLAPVDRALSLEQGLSLQVLDASLQSHKQRERVIDALMFSDLIGPAAPPAWTWRRWRLRLFLDLAPRGWLDQYKVSLAEDYQPAIEALAPAQRPLQRGRVQDALAFALPPDAAFTPSSLLRQTKDLNCTRAVQTTLQNQTQVIQARLACALERWRLVHGAYPASLAALTPDFLDALPNDVIGPQAPQYRRLPEGGFALSCAGWEEGQRLVWSQ